MNTHDIEELLQERGSQYGDFKLQVNVIAKILNNLRELKYQGAKPSTDIETSDVLNMFLVLKLCRMQTASDPDSLRDLIGYATLILKEVEKDERIQQ